MTTDTTPMRERRLNYLRQLENGDYWQANGALFKQDVIYNYSAYDDVETREVLPDTESYCCLGVARKVADTQWLMGTELNQSDSNDDYILVRNLYGISSPLQSYLMAMNDGGGVSKPLPPKNGTTKYKTIRTGGLPARDFRFIARFLRKVWRLTDVP